MKVNLISTQYNATQSTYVAANGFADILKEEIKELDRTKSGKITKRIVSSKDNASGIDFRVY